jgi:hypothetical protein
VDWPKSSAKRVGNTAGKENGAASVQQRRASLGFLDEEAKLDTEERRRLSWDYLKGFPWFKSCTKYP